MTLWETLRKAFDEGRDEEENGAPADLLLDVMMLAARADRVIDSGERVRITNLLTKHWRAYHGHAEGALEEKIQRSLDRLDAMGAVSHQLKGACGALVSRGERAAETGYSLAYAVLLAGGVDERERLFADELRGALGISSSRAASLEAKLDEAASFSQP